MPTRKIGDDTTIKNCSHHDHHPPSMMHFEPGIYEHECPGCHQKHVFTVRAKTIQVLTCACHGDGSALPGHGQVFSPPKDDGWQRLPPNKW